MLGVGIPGEISRLGLPDLTFWRADPQRKAEAERVLIPPEIFAFASS